MRPDAEPFDADELTAAFDYLDRLRRSGITNMYGAAPYLERELYMELRRARDALKLWMKTFDPDKAPEDRAATALATGAPDA
jgi:hypothetical protein